MAFYSKIVEKVKDLDIGLCVINAGVCHADYIDRVPTNLLQEMIDVNTYHVGALLQKFTTMLSQRNKPAGIIINSSIAAQFHAPRNFTYSATKVFAKYLALAAYWENKAAHNKIDVMALQPHYVKTKMIAPAEENGITFGTVSVESCVKAALRDLGYEQCTYGPSTHEIIGGALTFLLKAMPSQEKQKASKK